MNKSFNAIASLAAAGATAASVFDVLDRLVFIKETLPYDEPRWAHDTDDIMMMIEWEIRLNSIIARCESVCVWCVSTPVARRHNVCNAIMSLMASGNWKWHPADGRVLRGDKQQITIKWHAHDLPVASLIRDSISFQCSPLHTLCRLPSKTPVSMSLLFGEFNLIHQNYLLFKVFFVFGPTGIHSCERFLVSTSCGFHVFVVTCGCQSFEGQRTNVRCHAVFLLLCFHSHLLLSVSELQGKNAFDWVWSRERERAKNGIINVSEWRRQMTMCKK